MCIFLTDFQTKYSFSSVLHRRPKFPIQRLGAATIQAGAIDISTLNGDKKRKVSIGGVQIQSVRASESSVSGSMRDHSGFQRVVDALDVDERYQIQMLLQKLYRRLDVINSRLYKIGHSNSNAWSDDEEDDDDSGADFIHNLHKSKRLVAGAGGMMSVLEEEGDDHVTEFRNASQHSQKSK